MQQVSQLANCTRQRLLIAPVTLSTRAAASSAHLSLRTTRLREVHSAPARGIGRSNGVQRAAGRHALVMSAAASGANAADQKAAQGRPEDFLGEPLIFGPSEACQAPDQTNTLLVLAPGALIPAEDYRQLVEALQADPILNENVRLTVAVVSIDWKSVGFGSAVTSVESVAVAVEGAIAAAAEHITVKKSPSGRYEDVFLAGHSLMGVAAVRWGLEKAAGLLLLGSAMLPATSGLFPTAATWTRPVLQLSAELDGQQYLSKQAFSVLTAAESAAKLGLQHAATFQPSIVLPGLNHASFAAGQEKQLFPGAPALDLQPDVHHDTAVQQVARVLAEFLVVHRSSDAGSTAPENSERASGAAAAAASLVQRQLSSAAVVDPFLAALGRGSPVRALEGLQAEPYLPNPEALRPAGMVGGSFGGEVLRPDEDSRRWLAHPGELAAAEAFAVKVQLDAIPAGLRSRVVVVATAHTDESTFLYNQPTIDRLPDGKTLVRVHVYLWRHALETQERIQPAVAPEYALKLRTASAICRALGQDEEAERETVSHISGRKWNTQHFQEALDMVTQEVRERYQRRGKQFSFGADVSDAASPKEWVQQQHVRIQDTGERDTLITSPSVNTQKDGEPVPKLDSYSRGMGRFVGNHYIKVVSLARAVEWLMIDTLRPAQLQ